MSMSLPESPAATQRSSGTPYSVRTYSSACNLPARMATQSTYRHEPTPLMMMRTCDPMEFH